MAVVYIIPNFNNEWHQKFLIWFYFRRKKDLKDCFSLFSSKCFPIFWWDWSRYMMACCHDEDLKSYWSPIWWMSFLFVICLGLPNENDYSLSPRRRSEFIMSLDFFSFWSEYETDEHPKRFSFLGVFPALLEYLVVTINRFLEHDIIAISFSKRSNGLGANFFNATQNFIS